MSTSSEKQPVTGQGNGVAGRIDKSVYWLSRHWLAVFNTIIFIYVALPILAPVLMKAGIETPAKVIYTIYSPLCHQMTQRSFFLFGDQIAYPREIAGTDLVPIEAYVSEIPAFSEISTDNWPRFFAAARSFVGNEQMGYKMALCQRDIAIYGFILIGGLLYGLLRNRFKIKPLPLVAFLIIGLGPIALDGFSQLFSYWTTPLDGSTATGIASVFQDILPLRESTPFMRFATGALFGLALVWMAYPHVNEGMKGTERDLNVKLTERGIIEE